MTHGVEISTLQNLATHMNRFMKFMEEDGRDPLSANASNIVA